MVSYQIACYCWFKNFFRLTTALQPSPSVRRWCIRCQISGHVKCSLGYWVWIPSKSNVVCASDALRLQDGEKLRSRGNSNVVIIGITPPEVDEMWSWDIGESLCEWKFAIKLEEYSRCLVENLLLRNGKYPSTRHAIAMSKSKAHVNSIVTKETIVDVPKFLVTIIFI